MFVQLKVITVLKRCPFSTQVVKIKLTFTFGLKRNMETNKVPVTF